MDRMCHKIMEKIVGLKIPLDSQEEGANSNILLESEELDSIAVNRYYEVQKSNAVFGYAATLFNENDITALTKTMKSIQNIYPFVLEKRSEAKPGETDAMPYDHDIENSSFVLIRYVYIYILTTYHTFFYTELKEKDPLLPRLLA